MKNSILVLLRDFRLFIAVSVFFVGYGFAAVGDLNWEFQASLEIFGSPAVDSEGNIYFGSRDGYLYCVTPAGQEKWKFLTADWIDSSPTLSFDESVVYVGSWDNKMYAVSTANGSKRWEFVTGNLIVASPSLDSEGNLFFGSSDGFFYSLDPEEGEIRWEYFVGEEMDSSPAISSEGDVYFGAYDGFVYALSNDGDLLWIFETRETEDEADRRIKSPPTIGEDGTIYFGGGDGYLYALDSSGQKVWDFETDDKVDSGVAIGLDDELVFGSRDGFVYSLDEYGVLNWESYVGDVFYSTPAIDKSGNVYIGSYLGNGVSGISSIDSSGAIVWDYLILDYVDSSPAIDANGQLLFGGYDGTLYAVDVGLGLANTAWSRFGGDNSNRSFQKALPDVFFLSEGYDAWRISYDLFGSMAEPTADSDGDGSSQLIEYLTGGNPNESDIDLIRIEVIEQDGNKFCVIEFNRIKNELSLGLDFEQSNDLTVWSIPALSMEIVNTDALGDGNYETVRLIFSVPTASVPSFVRLKGSVL